MGQGASKDIFVTTSSFFTRSGGVRSARSTKNYSYRRGGVDEIDDAIRGRSVHGSDCRVEAHGLGLLRGDGGVTRKEMSLRSRVERACEAVHGSMIKALRKHGSWCLVQNSRGLLLSSTHSLRTASSPSMALDGITNRDITT